MEVVGVVGQWWSWGGGAVVGWEGRNRLSQGYITVDRDHTISFQVRREVVGGGGAAGGGGR